MDRELERNSVILRDGDETFLEAGGFRGNQIFLV